MTFCLLDLKKLILQFVLDLNWQVVARDESKEVEIQNLREVRMLEAVYPRLSAIPTKQKVVNITKQQTPQIPITPIEDEDAAIETPLNSHSQLLPPGILHTLHCSMPSVSIASADEKPDAGMVLNVEPCGVAAAFAAINQSNDPANVIDPDFLVKVLSNPRLIEKLIADYGAASGAQNLTESSSPLVPSPDLPPPANHSNPLPAHINRTENCTAFLSATSGGAFYATPNGVGVGQSNKQGPIPSVHPPSASPAPAVGLPQKKGLNYYKNLIQQHGGERQKPAQKLKSRYNQNLKPNLELINNPKPRDSRPKIMKPCMTVPGDARMEPTVHTSMMHSPA
ncbi:Mitochondrial [Hibiscus syriacus]|uniref:Mitochondrial n=1 Tax=Hibiscus syriacus TaxID=106335 RepID=A0A6A3BH78_HIBSY|nr:Mitochondrial [Hibiscus syriacus]